MSPFFKVYDDLEPFSVGGFPAESSIPFMFHANEGLLRWEHPVWHISLHEVMSYAAINENSDQSALRKNCTSATDILDRAVREYTNKHEKLNAGFILANTPSPAQAIRRRYLPTDRVVTAALLLNSGWEPSAGAELIFVDGQGELVSIRRRPGRLVVFAGDLPFGIGGVGVDTEAPAMTLIIDYV